MRRITFAFIFCSMSCFLSVASAQDEPISPADESTGPIIDLPSDVTVTPEMWMYLHDYQSNKDTKHLILKRAQERAQQRRARLAAQHWYGHSPLRPTANSIPQMGPSHGSTWIGLPWSPTQWTPYTSEYRTYRGTNRAYALPSVRIARQR